MGNVMLKAIDGNPIYNGSAIVSTSMPNGNYNHYHVVDGEDNYPQIDITCSGRFDTPRYYTGDTVD
jgi:hypothetical protein